MCHFITRLQSSNLFRSFIITAIGSGLSKAILILGTFYCTNTLTKLEFGEYSFVRNTLTMILTICASNYSGLCTKFATEAKSSIASLQRLLLLFLFSLFVCVLLGGILTIMPDSILITLLKTKESIGYFRLAGLLLPLFMVQPLIEGILRGLMKFKMVSWLQVLSSILYVVTLIVGIQLAGVDGAIWGLYLFYTIYAVASIWALIHIRNPHYYYSRLNHFWLEYHSIFKMVLPVFILSFVEAPILWYLQVLMTRYSSAEAVGSMTVMLQIQNFALLIPNYFFITYIAFAGRLNAEKKYEEYFARFDKFIKSFCLAGILIFVLFSLLSKNILVLFGSAYVGDWKELVVCCLGIPIALMMTLIKQSLILQEHQRELMYISITWNILWVVLFYYLVQIGFNTLMSFFISRFISWILNWSLSIWLYNKDKTRLLSKKQ